jgi:hypothetical protein
MERGKFISIVFSLFLLVVATLFLINIIATVSEISGLIGNVVGTGSPALYLKFDESSGTKAADSSGSGFTGSLVNGPTWVSGKSGNALRFDGVNDYVNMGNVLDIYNSITLSAWIKPDNISREQDIVCKNWQTSFKGYEFGFTPAGELKFRINPTPASWTYRYSSGAKITPGVWQHIAVTYDGTRIYFYKNGALISSVAASGKLYQSSGEPLVIGIYQSLNTFQFKGSMDEVRIYNRNLSSADIMQLYSGSPTTTTTKTTTTTSTTRTTTTSSTTTTKATTTSSTTPTPTTQPALSGPVIYLKFDESAGNRAFDSSGSNYSGSLVNGPVYGLMESMTTLMLVIQLLWILLGRFRYYFGLILHPLRKFVIRLMEAITE